MKKGTRVKITGNTTGIQYQGLYGEIDKKSWNTDRGQCYFVNIENGEHRSYLECYLTIVEDDIEKERDYITFDQVRQAKENVDKAQKAWVELLSTYQLQESLKK